jgi:hypothetical protein
MDTISAINVSSATRMGRRADIMRLVAIFLGPVMPFVILKLDGVVAEPATENDHVVLACAVLVIGSMTAGPALGLVAAARSALLSTTPTWLRLVAFLCIPVNALMLLLVLHMHGR